MAATGQKIPQKVRSARLKASVRDKDFLMARVRKSLGLSLMTVATAVGTNDGNLSRVERGSNTPKQELARALFEFYQRKAPGQLPLGAIYDPEYGEA